MTGFPARFSPPKPIVGSYRLDNGNGTSFVVCMYRKPNWFIRTMVRVCLGVYWMDVE